jgi:hypothetical protein
VREILVPVVAFPFFVCIAARWGVIPPWIEYLRLLIAQQRQRNQFLSDLLDVGRLLLQVCVDRVRVGRVEVCSDVIELIGLAPYSREPAPFFSLRPAQADNVIHELGPLVDSRRGSLRRHRGQEPFF